MAIENLRGRVKGREKICIQKKGEEANILLRWIEGRIKGRKGEKKRDEKYLKKGEAILHVQICIVIFIFSKGNINSGQAKKSVLIVVVILLFAMEKGGGGYIYFYCLNKPFKH